MFPRIDKQGRACDFEVENIQESQMVPERIA